MVPISWRFENCHGFLKMFCFFEIVRKGTGFQSKGSYLFGHFSMQIKMVPGDSAGTVTAFYVSPYLNLHFRFLLFSFTSLFLS